MNYKTNCEPIRREPTPLKSIAIGSKVDSNQASISSSISSSSSSSTPISSPESWQQTMILMIWIKRILITFRNRQSMDTCFKISIGLRFCLLFSVRFTRNFWAIRTTECFTILSRSALNCIEAASTTCMPNYKKWKNRSNSVCQKLEITTTSY